MHPARCLLTTELATKAAHLTVATATSAPASQRLPVPHREKDRLKPSVVPPSNRQRPPLFFVAMHLLHALHLNGLSTIPLTLSYRIRSLKRERRPRQLQRLLHDISQAGCAKGNRARPRETFMLHKYQHNYPTLVYCLHVVLCTYRHVYGLVVYLEVPG